jgi:putative endonuclease
MYNKNFSKEPTEKQKLGQVGEDLACEYLAGNLFQVVERNYLKKWGEIDIIAKKSGKLHFVEVKSVSREMFLDERGEVIHETSNDSYRAEDNMHPWKLQRLGRAIQSYLLDRDIPDNVDWQFDVVTVYVDQNRGLHKVLVLEDVVL